MHDPRSRFTVYAEPSETVRSPSGQFKGAFFEASGRYDVIWFAWDKDGNIPEFIIEDDWEPVVLHWKNGELAAVSVRPHYRWVDYFSSKLGINDKLAFSDPLEVMFLTSYHGARVRMPYDQEFDQFKINLKKLEYDLQNISRFQVPSYAKKPRFGMRTGLIPFGSGEDLYDRADKFAYR